MKRVCDSCYRIVDPFGFFIWCQENEGFRLIGGCPNELIGVEDTFDVTKRLQLKTVVETKIPLLVGVHDSPLLSEEERGWLEAKGVFKVYYVPVPVMVNGHFFILAFNGQGPDSFSRKEQNDLRRFTWLIQVVIEEIEAAGVHDLAIIHTAAEELRHKLRTPLAIIGGFAKLMLSNIGPGDPHQEFLEIIAKEVILLEQVINETLNGF
ncbi:hypothetical protein KKD20_04820 [Patescibacteria group bacterium]|nr:hypothetical protein [Patescibacteria group bacterium]